MASSIIATSTLREVSDKIPHPDLVEWWVIHLVAGIVFSVVAWQAPWTARPLLALALLWLSLVAIWVLGFVQPNDAIARSFAEEQGSGYLLEVLLGAAVPVVLAGLVGTIWLRFGSKQLG